MAIVKVKTAIPCSKANLKEPFLAKIIALLERVRVTAITRPQLAWQLPKVTVVTQPSRYVELNAALRDATDQMIAMVQRSDACLSHTGDYIITLPLLLHRSSEAVTALYLLDI